jgi:ParB-like chromosome segregation protein Spo0J
MKTEKLIKQVKDLIAKESDLQKKVDLCNAIKLAVHEAGPFSTEPVDCVIWVSSQNVVANDYNPNKVAPPEMELLEVSIVNDGYTQPIVTWPKEDGTSEVVDGFHRSRVGKESSLVSKRVLGFLPVVQIRKEQTGKNDRVASTIRHNRARGKHQIDAMSEIVLELKNRNWSNKRIAKELGMDEDEILRLCQITGLDHLFSDKDFSKAWEASDSVHIFDPLTDDVNPDEIEVRTANTSDPTRKFHTYENWECHKAGFYNSRLDGFTNQECQQMYVEIMKNEKRFRQALQNVISNWHNSCEHYLTNKAMNRIAWLGQAAVCIDSGVPSVFCSGFNLLTEKEQLKANNIALEYLNKWLFLNGLPNLTLEQALSVGRQVDIY